MYKIRLEGIFLTKSISEGILEGILYCRNITKGFSKGFFYWRNLTKGYSKGLFLEIQQFLIDIHLKASLKNNKNKGG